MSLALTVLFWILVVLLVLLAALLVLPVRISINLVLDTASRFLVIVRPFDGISPPLRVFDSARKRDKAERKPKAKKPKPETPKKRRRARDFRPALSEVPVLARQLLQAIHIEALSVRGEFGLGDPADTGEMFGYLTPLIYGSGGVLGAQVSLKPNFDRACLRGELDSRISVVPMALISPLLGFVWKAYRQKR